MLTVPTFGTVSEEFRIFIAKNLTSRNNANVKKMRVQGKVWFSYFRFWKSVCQLIILVTVRGLQFQAHLYLTITLP